VALCLGYTYTDTKVYNNGSIIQYPLIPMRRLNSTLVYQAEGKWKFYSELYYFSKQILSDGSEARDNWLAGLVIEKRWKKFSSYLNFENFGNARQTKLASICTDTLTDRILKKYICFIRWFYTHWGD
jgi:outer membrane receptor for ferrienterochelin and colicins